MDFKWILHGKPLRPSRCLPCLVSPPTSPAWAALSFLGGERVRAHDQVTRFLLWWYYENVWECMIMVCVYIIWEICNPPNDVWVCLKVRGTGIRATLFSGKPMWNCWAPDPSCSISQVLTMVSSSADTSDQKMRVGLQNGYLLTQQTALFRVLNHRTTGVNRSER